VKSSQGSLHLKTRQAGAARQIAQFAELCRASNRSKGDPIHCAVAAYHGSWERPDNRFADVVRATAAKDDAPDFEMRADLRLPALSSCPGHMPAHASR
jgi:hypothetical protein